MKYTPCLSIKGEEVGLLMASSLHEVVGYNYFPYYLIVYEAWAVSMTILWLAKETHTLINPYNSPSTLQSTGVQPLFTNSSFALLKHLLCIKGLSVLVAPSGLG